MKMSEKRLIAVLVILVISYISTRIFLSVIHHYETTARAKREELISAVIRDNARQVAKCLRQGTDPNLRIPVDTAYEDYIGQHILTVAISNNDFDAALILVRGGADVNIHDVKSPSPLMMATEAGSTSLVAELLKDGANIHVHDQHSPSLLFTAVRIPYGSPKIAQLLLDHGIDGNLLEPSQHQTALIQVIDNQTSQCQTDLVKVLLKNHCNLELKNDSGNTALRIAENRNNLGIVHLLRQAGAKEMSVFPSIQREPVEYAITDLGPGQANTLNDRGEVVGISGHERNTDGALLGKAFLWRQGKLQLLDKHNIIASNAISINNQGEVLGVSYSHQTSGAAKYQISTFIWKDGRMRDVTSPFNEYNSTEISTNVLVGNNRLVDTIAYVYHRKIWESLHKTWIRLPDGPLIENNMHWDGADYTAINHRGTITFYLQASGTEHAGIWKNGKMHELPFPPAIWESGNGHPFKHIPNFHAVGINDHDDVVGYCDNGKGDAMLWSHGKAITLPHMKEYTGQYFAMCASAINNEGDIVGVAAPQLGDDPTEHHAVLWKHGKVEDLNAAIPANSDWVLEYVHAINAKGQIVGNGFYRDQAHAFLLTPHTETMRVTNQ